MGSGSESSGRIRSHLIFPFGKGEVLRFPGLSQIP